MQIELEKNVVDVLAKLRAQAAAHHVPLDTYLEQFVQADHVSLNGAPSLEEFDAVLNELAAAPPNAPSLPADFSRADIYADHN
jgi:hypothetical protein